MLLEVVHEVVESGDVLGVGGLLALHGGDDNLVAKGEFGEISLSVGLRFVELKALGEEVVEDFVLNGLGMRLFVDDPAGELVSVFTGFF